MLLWEDTLKYQTQALKSLVQEWICISFLLCGSLSTTLNTILMLNKVHWMNKISKLKTFSTKTFVVQLQPRGKIARRGWKITSLVIKKQT